ncbi:MAG TPA: 30S ribosomal protein S3ae [Candidatus Thermoplasmatota archaeon]|nr:30S ribosomal protein S3ae [Candidatus Thermoplasmatota archaeon]
MALARARQAARRVKDRWKSKTWFRITAPPAFNSQLIAETLSDEPQKLMQRTVEATLHELTGDMKQMHVKLIFQVKEVADNNAKTAFVGHTMTSDYVRRLTRRGNNKIPLVMDLKTKDGSRIRVKPFAVTDKRCQTTQNMGIRRAMARVLEEAAEKSNLSAFLADMLVGDLNNRMYKEARKVHPLRRIEIGKSEMLQAPTIEVDETPIVRRVEAAPEGAPAEGAPAAPATEAGAAAPAAAVVEEAAKKVEDLAGEEDEE